MKVKRRKFLRRMVSISVLVLVGAGVSRDGRLYRYLREFREKFDSVVNKADETPVDHEDVPEVAEYLSFLAGLNLRYFSPQELVSPHRNVKRGVRNHIPPKPLWNEITHTLRMIDELRDRLGVRAEILSIYRSPAYNTAINGASHSQHMQNRAIDLKFACSSDEAFAVAEQMRKDGLFSGGLGWYSSFIHIDTRGYEATWGKES